MTTSGLEETGAPVEDQELSKDQLLDLLSEEEEEEEEEKNKNKIEEEDRSGDKKVTKTEEDEEEEDEEEKIELKDDEEVDDELVTPVRMKDITKKYPKLFKDFPILEHAYRRDAKYSELFGTVEDAEEAAEAAQTLQEHEESLMKGSPETVLAAVKENDTKAFGKLVDNFLPTLAKIDRESYLNVLSNVVRNTVASMARAGQQQGNKELRAAATEVNKFVFGTTEFTPPSQPQNEDDDKEDELEQERQEFLRERFETARSDLSQRVQNVLKTTIDSNIDPRDSMTSYVKRNAVRDALEELDRVIGSDQGFGRVLNRLWEQAAEQKFDSASIKKIRSTFLAKAKTHLPDVIKKARQEALQGQGKKAVARRKSLPTTRSEEAPKKIPRNMSTLDYLNME